MRHTWEHFSGSVDSTVSRLCSSQHIWSFRWTESTGGTLLGLVVSCHFSHLCWSFPREGPTASASISSSFLPCGEGKAYLVYLKVLQDHLLPPPQKHQNQHVGLILALISLSTLSVSCLSAQALVGWAWDAVWGPEERRKLKMPGFSGSEVGGRHEESSLALSACVLTSHVMSGFPRCLCYLA